MPAKPDPTVPQRKENQQDRIAQGVKSGQLTSGETTNLESKEAAINGEIRADRAANGGKLTQGEKRQINHDKTRHPATSTTRDTTRRDSRSIDLQRT
jgi:hypothetical protein